MGRASLVTATITATNTIRSTRSALSVYSGSTKGSRGLSSSLTPAVVRVDVAHPYNKWAEVRGRTKSPSFIDLPSSKSGDEASARPQGRSKYGRSGAPTIRPPPFHDHVHTIYSPRRPAPRRSCCPVAVTVREAVEPRQRQQRTIPCNLGMFVLC